MVLGDKDSSLGKIPPGSLPLKKQQSAFSVFHFQLLPFGLSDWQKLKLHICTDQRLYNNWRTAYKQFKNSSDSFCSVWVMGTEIEIGTGEPETSWNRNIHRDTSSSSKENWTLTISWRPLHCSVMVTHLTFAGHSPLNGKITLESSEGLW